MLRESILSRLKELRLEGMRSAYDEVFAVGQKRGDTAEKLFLALIEAEATERSARGLRYRLIQARFPIQKELEHFDFTVTQVDEARTAEISQNLIRT